ncbi:MAG: glycosyltransferase family 4 protein, partial [bacterium]
VDRALSSLPSPIIANSDAIRARFHRGGRPMAKAVTIINGVDAERFHPGLSGNSVRERYGIAPGCVIAGVVGRISPVKGQRAFLEAAAALLPRLPDLRFLIVGSGLFPGEKEHEAALRAFAEENDMAGRVIFTGYQTDVRPFMAALDICVVPSLEEGCGRAIFEAMALEKPVVGTDSGGTPEIVAEGETGALVPPRDPRALAEAIERLAKDESLRREWGRAGRRRVEAHLTLERNARRTEAAYLRLLGEEEGAGDG